MTHRLLIYSILIFIFIFLTILFDFLSLIFQNHRLVAVATLINAGLKALSCAIIGDGLPVGKVNSAVDDGGAAGSNIFVTDRALTNSMAWPVTKRADFRTGAEAVV